MSAGTRSSGRPPSIVEVAESAGVSRQTVSRVVNDVPGVLPDTRERVMAAIATLGYRRNRAAASLVTQRSGLIGVVTVGSFLFGPTSTLTAIEQAARERGYTILLSTLRSSELDEIGPSLAATLERGVEAIIVIASREEMVRRLAAIESPVPVLLVGPRVAGVGGLTTLSVDQRAGASMAVDFLVEQGHRDIALLVGPPAWVDAQDRREAAVEQCRAYGIRPRLMDGDWSAASGHQAGLLLVAEAGSGGAQLPTAVFAANDAMALGLLSAFHERGVSVPGTVSVVGFDDVAESAFYSPPLTTVRQDFSALGARVIEAALAMLAGEEPELSLVPASLVVRGSVARRAGSR